MFLTPSPRLSIVVNWPLTVLQAVRECPQTISWSVCQKAHLCIGYKICLSVASFPTHYMVTKYK